MTSLSEDTFFLDPDFEGTLQAQIRQIIARAVLSRRLLAGERLPSSRKLASHLGISRITVTLSYQELVADGYLETRARSGYFVAADAPAPALDANPAKDRDLVDWDRVVTRDYATARMVEKPLNWREYPYPFIYGQADPALFSHSNWRLCAHQALGKREFDSLTQDYAHADDPKLVDFIVRHTLPRRGIAARSENVLLTIGAQHALWMVGHLLLDRDRQAVMEKPGYPGLREILDRTGCGRHHIAVDEAGLNPDLIPSGVDAVFLTPSHHCPTAATLPLSRRRALLDRAARDNFIVVEDDYEFEMSFLDPPQPALKSLDTEGRVIYVGSFSKSLFPGLRLGYLVGSARFIEQARGLRAMMLRHPPGHVQRTTANFLALGHYDALVARMKRALQVRHEAMAEALDRHGLRVAGSAAFGGSSFWVAAPDHVNTSDLAHRLHARGVLIEPGEVFFDGSDRPHNFMRLAYSSIDASKIARGVALIAQEIDAAVPATRSAR